MVNIVINFCHKSAMIIDYVLLYINMDFLWRCRVSIPVPVDCEPTALPIIYIYIYIYIYLTQVGFTPTSM